MGKTQSQVQAEWKETSEKGQVMNGLKQWSFIRNLFKEKKKKKERKIKITQIFDLLLLSFFPPKNFMALLKKCTGSAQLYPDRSLCNASWKKKFSKTKVEREAAFNFDLSEAWGGRLIRLITVTPLKKCVKTNKKKLKSN